MGRTIMHSLSLLKLGMGQSKACWQVAASGRHAARLAGACGGLEQPLERGCSAGL